MNDKYNHNNGPDEGSPFIIDIDMICFDSIDKYYSKKGLVERYKKLQVSEDKFIFRKCFIPTKTKNTFIVKSKRNKNFDDYYINYILKSNRTENTND